MTAANICQIHASEIHRNRFIIKRFARKVKSEYLLLFCYIDIPIIRVIIRIIGNEREEESMIICYKCKKEIQKVSDIGEIIRSYDGDDFCFCKECSEELKEMDREEGGDQDGR